jgi:hypothetical protein
MLTVPIYELCLNLFWDAETNETNDEAKTIIVQWLA